MPRCRHGLKPHDGETPAVLLTDCNGVSLRDVVVECRGFKGAAVLLEDCDETLVDGVTLRSAESQAANAVRYRLAKAHAFSGLRITNVSARDAAEAGIVLEATKGGKSSLSDYRIVGNLATVADRIGGERAILANNRE